METPGYNSDSFDRIMPLAAIALASAMWSLRYLPVILTDSGLWGVNHLIFLPDLWKLIYLVLGLLGIGTVFLSRKSDSALLCSVSRALFTRWVWWRWLLLSLIALLVFWFLKMPANFLGDGLAVISDVGNDLPVIFKWSETGAIRLVHLVSQVLPQAGLEGARMAYAVVAVLSGAVTVFFFAGIAFELGGDSKDRFFAFCLLCFSGWMLLFFGYAENYPVIWPFITGYTWFALKHIKHGSGLVGAVITLVIATVMHLQVLFFAPTLLVVGFGQGRGKEFFRKYRLRIAAVLALLILAGLTLFIIKYSRSLEFRIHFLPVFTGRPALPDYAILSLRHLLDIFNEMSLIVPLWPLLLLVGWRWWWGPRKKPGDDNVSIIRWFLLIFSLGGLIFLFIFDPKLGMGRDWDLFALAGLGPMLLIISGLNDSTERMRKTLPVIAIFAFAMVLPFFIVNLSFQPSLKYYGWLLDHEYPRTESGMVGLIHYYYNTGNYPAADSLKQRVKEIYPRAAIEKRALDLAQSGDFGQAMLIADSLLMADPYSSKPYNIRGLVYFYRGEYEKAIPDLEQAARLVPESPPVLVNLAMAYHRIRQVDKMMAVLRQAQKIDPDYLKTIEALATGFYAEGQYDSAMVYAERLIQRDPINENGYFIAGVSAFAIGSYQQSKSFINRFLELNPESPDKPKLLDLLNQIEQVGY